MTKSTSRVSLLVVATVILFGACKKSEEAKSDSIIGSWEFSSYHMDVVVHSTPPQNLSLDSTFVHGSSPVLTFNTNNTYKSVGHTTMTASTLDSGTYLLLPSGKMEIYSSMSQNTDTADYTISGDKLHFITTSTEPNGLTTATYTINEALTRQ